MKLLILVFMFIALVASSLGLKNEICGLPHSFDGNGRISCDAYIPSWSYDSGNNECIEFIFGGCGGNANRFDSKEICEKKCLE
ncbi:male accessory gland serine protease inhibitor-like [Drosophila rhopaloa]|uniref:Male accessory gland serine protease inhibitor-like n=1 Tax=Drosophila rhopaloa TaxID=1041015 RepID=A0A6P4EX62_DRORH|nr:male accessory gland serine protease inhibitor-like [Drosophila rhopaloa]